MPSVANQFPFADTFGAGTVAESKLEKAARQILIFAWREIIQMLDLKRPPYRQTAAYGHMGRIQILTFHGTFG